VQEHGGSSERVAGRAGQGRRREAQVVEAERESELCYRRDMRTLIAPIGEFGWRRSAVVPDVRVVSGGLRARFGKTGVEGGKLEEVERN
jgi:hypothetical protein